LSQFVFDDRSFFPRYAFATFDANNDGAVDFGEFLLAIAAGSQGDLDDRLEVTFNM
jgi:neurocalcin delta